MKSISLLQQYMKIYTCAICSVDSLLFQLSLYWHCWHHKSVKQHPVINKTHIWLLYMNICKQPITNTAEIMTKGVTPSWKKGRRSTSNNKAYLYVVENWMFGYVDQKSDLKVLTLLLQLRMSWPTHFVFSSYSFWNTEF